MNFTKEEFDLLWQSCLKYVYWLNEVEEKCVPGEREITDIIRKKKDELLMLEYKILDMKVEMYGEDEEEE